mmetsp:Transcript_174059/g.558054  ORF Transcript_174059/g.558054 Transcript_174059/m.558054 type:complete len:756 (-) Transcript_174059:268-2535(-)
MSPSQDAAGECSALCQEIQATLRDADERWRDLEVRLDEAAESVLRENFERLREPLGLRESDLEATSEGSLRQKVRGRVERFVLAPLTELMRQKVRLPLSADKASTDPLAASSRHVLDEFVEHWENEVEPLLRGAGVEDAKLERKALRQAKMPGAGPAVWKAQADLQQGRLWSSAQSALQAFLQPARALATFLDVQVSSAAVEMLVAALPAIVARAACDWRFVRCAAEFEQLDAWWQSARSALQKKQQLWEQILQEEGLFVRRVERGIEALSTARLRYMTLADFGDAAVTFDGAQCLGGGEWPSTEVSLLAEAVKDMRTRLRPIRDGAAWRVVDAAKVLQRKLAGGASGGAQREPTPWERAGRQDGARSLAQALTKDEAKKGLVDFSDPSDTALVFMQRLDCLLAVVGDIREFASSQAPGAGLRLVQILDQLLQTSAAASEDILGVLDEPSPASIEAWRKQWDQIGVGVRGAALGDAVMALHWQPESRLSMEGREVRKSRLSLLRGIQVFVEESAFRGHLLEPLEVGIGVLALPAFTAHYRSVLADKADLPSSAQVLVTEVPAVDQPPAPLAVETLSPRDDQCDYSPPSRRAPTEAVLPTPSALPGVAAVVAGQAPSPPNAEAERAHARVREALVMDVLGQAEVLTLAPSEVIAEASAQPQLFPAPAAPLAPMTWTRPSTAESSCTRPATPSWLLPPWPRPDTPSAASWTRPDTPSTVCDDAELSHLPRVKFVDGQRVSMRPCGAIAGARLPPLVR